jgi:hypothetical protein
MKRFEEIKNQPHDASGLDNPNEYLWQQVSANVTIWYPAERIEKNENKFSEDSFIEDIDDGWNSGGHIFLDTITMKDGTVLVISDELMCLYLNQKSFDEGEKPLRSFARPTLYQVISPDGFAFHPTDVFSSVSSAWKAFENDYKKRYEPQGYYSTANRTRIPLDQLKNYCSVKPI